MKNNPRNIITITNEYGIDINVRLRLRGDNHGRNMALTHTRNKPVVEMFIDGAASNNIIHGKDLGFFVSSYFLETLQEVKATEDILLYGGEPNWSITSSNLLEIKRSFCQYLTIT